MSQGDGLISEDFRGIARLLGSVIGLNTTDGQTRRSALLGGLAALVKADVWIWTQTRLDPSGRPSAYSIVDGGWRDGAQRAEFLRINTSPDARPFERAMLARLDGSPCAVEWVSQLVPPEDAALRAVRAAGIEPGLVALYRLNDHLVNGVGLHTFSSSAPLTPKAREIVRLVVAEVDGLHRDGSENDALTLKTSQLTDRQRTVLHLLMDGATRKATAKRLGLSEHTIAEYIQQIYRHYGVNSRAELLSLFLSGGTKRTK